MPPTVRVFVLEDSASARDALCRSLPTSARIAVVGSAHAADAALARLASAPADAVLASAGALGADPCSAVRDIARAAPGAAVLVMSPDGALDARLASAGVEPLRRPASWSGADAAALGAAVERRARAAREASVAPALRPGPTAAPDILAFGCSTGGPHALTEVVRHLRGLAQPILVTQHMPEQFTRILAEQIGAQAGLPSAEGADGEPVLPGRVYVAPGGRHMTVVDGKDRGGLLIRLDDGPPENFCRPSVDPMLRSLAALRRLRTLVVVLTGMGRDGLDGSRAVAEAGGHVVAQDEASSVVWGMPGAVVRAGLCSAVLPLAEIGPFVRNLSARGDR